MKYLFLLPLLVFLFYMISFIVHNWNQKNRLAAVGTALITIAAVALPAFYLFFA